ncbi:MAG: LysM peptidoglycan-binding domain-containing protein [Candidatus Saccharibacteria bacterium]|nr:LysM peptidoglycan-binding domain-containing protein [Candidatus Saccharibacteria bacterium]
MTAAIAAIVLCAGVFVTQSATADALSPAELSTMEDSPTLLEDLAEKHERDKEEIEKELQKEKEKREESKPKKYKVKEGDTLISIAKEHDTTWKRLFYANEEVEHPDELSVDEELTVPDENEELEERELPELNTQSSAPEGTSGNSRAASATTRRNESASRSTSSTSRSRTTSSSAGNRYVRGYCTWYVKNRRPDLPNNLGNAISWVSRAASQGLPTGSTPRAGAVGQSGNHVVYVESVNGNGTVTVSEMNWNGWNVKSSRTAPASSFRYIY